jgi:hypothetical protein
LLATQHGNRIINKIIITKKCKEIQICGTNLPYFKMSALNILQECKIMLVFRTICLLVNAFIVAMLIKEDIFNVLNADGVKMVGLF